MRQRLRVGLTYNLKRIRPTVLADGGVEDREAEYDSPSTVSAIRAAIRSYGHQVVDLEATSDLPRALQAARVDFVFNIAVGAQGVDRESEVPALLERLGIPYTGSRPEALALSLDKARAKSVVQRAGIATPAFQVMETGDEPLQPALDSWPLIVKPVAEGSSKGVGRNSIATSEAHLRRLVRDLVDRYRQPALVEEYVSGREFTVGILEACHPPELPPMEIVFADPTDPTPIYRFEDKLSKNPRIRYEAPARVEPVARRRLVAASRIAFSALGCRDVARMDFRLDVRGRPSFLECNPLPGLTPGWSDLVLIAQAVGMEFRELIAAIFAGAAKRHFERGGLPQAHL